MQHAYGYAQPPASGYGARQEVMLFQEGIVQVTSARFVVARQTFPIIG